MTGVALEATELTHEGAHTSAPAPAAAPSVPATTTTPGGGGAKWTLSWEAGSVEVYALGGMVLPKFTAPDGSTVSPLFVAPWTRDPDVSKYAFLDLMSGSCDESC